MAAMQLQDRVADGLAHSLDLMLAALMQRQLELRGAEPADSRGSGAAVLEVDTFTESSQCVFIGLALLDALAPLREAGIALCRPAHQGHVMAHVANI